MSANSKPWKLHKLCFLLQMLIPPHPNTSLLSWSPSCASFLGRFSSSYHTEGEQPTGNVRAKRAPLPALRLLCGGSGGSQAGLSSAGLTAEPASRLGAQRCPCPQCEGPAVGYVFSYLVTESHPGPASSSLQSVLCVFQEPTPTLPGSQMLGLFWQTRCGNSYSIWMWMMA